MVENDHSQVIAEESYLLIKHPDRTDKNRLT